MFVVVRRLLLSSCFAVAFVREEHYTLTDTRTTALQEACIAARPSEDWDV